MKKQRTWYRRLFKQEKFKQNVADYIHNNYLLTTETAVHFRIRVLVVLKWERIYYEKESQAIYLERR